MEEYNFQRDYKCAALLKEVRASDQSLLGVGKGELVPCVFRRLFKCPTLS